MPEKRHISEAGKGESRKPARLEGWGAGARLHTDQVKRSNRPDLKIGANS